MSKENRVSDERLSLIAAGIADRLGLGVSGAPDLDRDIASAITELLAFRSKPVAGVEVKPTNAAEWVLVPAEPTVEMMSAAMDKMGTWIAPYTSPRESGVPTGNDISMVEATTFNTAHMDDYAVTYRAMVAAAPSGEARALSLEEEVKRLRKVVSAGAAALPNGAFIHPELASIEFMEKLPGEIASVCAALTEKENG